jgi:GNAT superfamily N-acetyltransferase
MYFEGTPEITQIPSYTHDALIVGNAAIHKNIRKVSLMFRAGIALKIVVGCDIEEFKRYYGKLAEDKDWQGTFWFTEELGTDWERILVENSSLLIDLRENHEIVGHRIWHESNTDEHRRGDPRDEEDRQILKKLAEVKGGSCELHEIWLRQEFRGKGYGKRFFEFFEDFLKKRGYSSFVYYADHPAALAICRERGYKEAFMEKERWYVFYHSLEQSP